MLTRIKQWLCSHRYDLADLTRRDTSGQVRCRCYKCGAEHVADCGLHLPGVFDRNSNIRGATGVDPRFTAAHFQDGRDLVLVPSDSHAPPVGVPQAGRLLTETADYDTPGSWRGASAGWPEIRGDEAYAMYVFANCVQSVPYGSYVLIAQRGRYGAAESVLRVLPQQLEKLKSDFERAGKPDAETSVARRELYGKPNQFGNKEAAPLWTARPTAQHEGNA